MSRTFTYESRDELIAGLRDRASRVAEEVRQLVRDLDHWNRLHPDETPLTVDDDQGRLRAGLRSIGLDLDALIAEARA